MWRKIDELYSASSDGCIRNDRRGTILKMYMHKDGYLRTQLHGKTVTVHRVIATSFVENPNDLPEINHKNGIKVDNRADNLEWVTRSDNLKHAYSTALRSAKGVNNSRNKLSLNDVRYIKKNYCAGSKLYGAKALAERFNVAPQTISAVVSGQNWKDDGV